MESISIFLLLSFPPLLVFLLTGGFFRPSFALNFGRPNFPEMAKFFNVQRKEGQQHNLLWILSQNVAWFYFVCNSVRIGPTLKNKVPLKRSILTNSVANHLNSLNSKLYGSRKENMHSFNHMAPKQPKRSLKGSSQFANDRI